MPTHRILGIDFFGGTSREAVDEISRTGGLLVAPAAPSMIAHCRDPDYRSAILSAQMAIADSGFMVLLWRFFTGESVPRISGLEHVKRLLEHETVRQPGATVWVVPTETSREKLLEFLGGTRAVASVEGRFGSTGSRPTDEELETRTRQRTSLQAPASAPGVAVPRPAFQDLRNSTSQLFNSVYVAPKYGRPVADEALLALVQRERPKHIVIAVGGGIQDKLGQYLIEQLDYRPAIHCIGAALGFITGDQVRIPEWADKYYLGWFFRSVAQPRVFIPRFWSARRLPWLIWRYRDRLPPLKR